MAAQPHGAGRVRPGLFYAVQPPSTGLRGNSVNPRIEVGSALVNSLGASRQPPNRVLPDVPGASCRPLSRPAR